MMMKKIRIYRNIWGVFSNINTIAALRPEHLGQIVVFIGKNADGEIYRKQIGVIKSYRNDGRRAFVAYNNAGEDQNYMNYTGAATSYDDLRLTNINIDKLK